MHNISRRTALGYSAIVLSGVGSAAQAASPPIVAPVPTNPLAAHVGVITMVTPDMDASIKFYCDLLDHEVIGRGSLEGKLPTVRGIGVPGRRYTLLKLKNTQNPERGIVRLLEAPADAKANRPRPPAQIMDSGMATVELMSTDTAKSYERLTKAGVKSNSPPLYYYRPAVKPMPGSTDSFAQEFEIFTYSAFGPAGEQLFISQTLTQGGKPFKFWNGPTLHSDISGFTLSTRDRWPTWHFYKDVFGLTPTKDQYSYHPHKDYDIENINTLLAAPPGTYYRFGGLGDGMGIEWYEVRQWEPTAVPPYPTDLDRTGLAMATVIVDNLATVRANLQAAKISTIGEGALPMADGKARDGLYIRGAVGELIEVIDRQS